jgi:hypothetical protein
VIGMDLLSVFCRQIITFSSIFVEKAVFSPLYVFDDFVKNKMGVAVRFHIWALYSVTPVFIPVFAPVPCCFYCYGSGSIRQEE